MVKGNTNDNKQTSSVAAEIFSLTLAETYKHKCQMKTYLSEHLQDLMTITNCQSRNNNWCIEEKCSLRATQLHRNLNSNRKNMFV